MSKKNKNKVTQRQMLDGVVNNQLLFDDAKVCKQLLVAYLHEKTENLNSDEKRNYAMEHIFPLNKKIDLFYELDKLNNKDLIDTYYRLRKIFIDMNNLNIESYFKLVSLVEILLIGYKHYKTYDDDTLEYLATVFVYNTNINYDLLKEELGESLKK